MPLRRFEYLVEVVGWPLPAHVDRRFHYFRMESAALRFIAGINGECRFEKLYGGATFQKPVTYATLEHGGRIFEVRHELGYELTEDDVFEAWQDQQMLGCDCSRSDLIIRSGCDEFHKMGHGNTIQLCGRPVVNWEANPLEFELH